MIKYNCIPAAGNKVMILSSQTEWQQAPKIIKVSKILSMFNLIKYSGWFLCLLGSNVFGVELAMTHGP